MSEPAPDDGTPTVSQELIAQLLDVKQPSAFEEMIKSLMHNDNAVRCNAEGALEACKNHAAPFTEQLIQLLRNSQDTSIRSMSAVLLRKVRA